MKRKKRWGATLLAVCAVALLLIGGYCYFRSMQQALWEQMVSETLEVTSQGSHSFEVYIKKDMETLDNLARNLSQDASGDVESILNKLDMFDDSQVNYTVIDLANGVLYSNYMDDGRRMNESELAAYEDFADRGIREPYQNEYAGQKTLGYYERFTFADGAQGIVQKAQLLSEVSAEFSLSFFDDAGFSYVVNRQGDILIRSNHKNSNQTFANIFDEVELNGNSKEVVESLRKSMERHEQGAIGFRYDKQEYVLAFVPVDIKEGWYLFSIIPNNVITAHTDQILKTTQSFVGVIGIVIFVFVCFLAGNRHYQRNMMEKEAEVKYREQLFSLLANNTDDVYLMLSSEDYAVEYVSPNIERVLGVTQEEVRENLSVLKVEGINYNWLGEFATGGYVVFERERVHRKNGERKWFRELVYRVAVDAADRFIVVLQDQTQHKQEEATLKEALENAKAANEAKSNFLSNMSHDIRTPMNAIIGFVALLRRDANNPELVLEHTEKIAASSQHLLGLINDVLDMSKIESGKTTLNISEINLAELVKELRAIIQPQVHAKQQEFELLTYDVKAENLLGDKLRINQVLINILSNAVKYTPIGGRIETEIRQLPQISKNHARLRFVIRDNGIGISQEYLGKIFQPFTRENNGAANRVQGTGLGMAITKNLVELMGGTISVESTQGEGTTFTVELELRMQKQNEDKNFWKEHGIRRVFIVDDEIDICTSIQKTIGETGIEVQYALDGAAAVETVCAEHEKGADFDLILVDWKMPEMDGIETVRRIRRMIPSDISIMILSAYDWSEIEQESVQAGVDGFLSKPFFLSNFKQAIINLKSGGRTETAGEEEEDGSLMGMHFLAAEDNELNSEIIAELLDMMGATCELAANGREAVQKFEESQPGTYDAILMDIQMPVMDGYEATRAIRAGSHPDAARIPIVAMTANAFAEDVHEAMKAGMNAHIAKPLDVDVLRRVIRQLDEEKVQ